VWLEAPLQVEEVAARLTGFAPANLEAIYAAGFATSRVNDGDEHSAA
jgi:hypothetical protein